MDLSGWLGMSLSNFWLCEVVRGMGPWEKGSGDEAVASGLDGLPYR